MRKVDKAMFQLVVGSPFFGSIALKRPIIETEHVGTAAVDRHGNILMNPRFVDNLSEGNIVFLLAHEAMHVALAHLARQGSRSPDLWGLACDAVINALLVKENVGEPIHGGVYVEGAEQFTAEQLYDMFKSNTPMAMCRFGDPSWVEGAGGTSDASGGSAQHSKNGKVRDYHKEASSNPYKDLLKEEANAITKEQADLAITNGIMEVSQAYTATRMAGTQSSTLQRFVELVIEKPLPWHKILEEYITRKAEQKQSWSRPNKRIQSAYLPRRARNPHFRHMVIGVDTSGSITDEEFQAFRAHLENICLQCKPQKIDVLYVDTEIEQHDTYTVQDFPIRPAENRWCGGTDMRVITDWASKLDELPDVVVILTDGYTPVPERYDGGLFWVVTTPINTDGWIGKVFRLD